MKLEIVKLTPCYVQIKSLEQAANFFNKKLKIKKINSLVVVFVSSKKSKELNYKYRKKNKPTDILSFSSIEEGVLGELVICMDIIKQQSIEHKLSQRDELSYMLLHGILHLLGYDHEKTSEAKKMFGIQDHIYSKYLIWQKKN